MADRTGLKFVGYIFASVTLAVVFASVTVVSGYASGRYQFDSGRAQAETISLVATR